MLKKRLIGVVTVKDGWAVQSFGYRRYLPLGKPECLVNNLNRWGADEILVQAIDRSTSCKGPDFELLERLGKLGLETPLIYAGGIRTVEEGLRSIELGADRIAVDTLLHVDPDVIRGLAERLGAQALIASLPLSRSQGRLSWLDYRNGSSKPLTPELLALIREATISEIMVTDWEHEGRPGAFDSRLVDEFPSESAPIIAFGGISEAEQIRELLRSPKIAAVAIGNFLSYRELAIQSYKEMLAGMPVRPATYQSHYSLVPDA